MAGYSSGKVAKEAAADYLHLKLFGATIPGGESFNDVDPGSPPPTDPGPCPNDPTVAELEAFVLATHQWMLGTIRVAVDG